MCPLRNLRVPNPQKRLKYLSYYAKQVMSLRGYINLQVYREDLIEMEHLREF